jgi:hypothetical protein
MNQLTAALSFYFESTNPYEVVSGSDRIPVPSSQLHLKVQ